MTIEQIMACQKDIQTLQSRFADLNRVYTSSPVPEHDVIVPLPIAEENLALLALWLGSLPADTLMWHYAHIWTIATYYVEVLLAGILHTLRIHLTATSGEIESILNDMLERAHILMRDLYGIFNSYKHGFSLRTESVLQLEPDLIAPILRIWLFPLQTKQPFIVPATYRTTRVSYHPDPIFRVLNTCISRLFSREQDFTVTLTQTYDSFQIEVCRPDFRLTPGIWQEVNNPFSDDIEHLHEMGGQIEPLAWDEGYGQGVIMRLPWATSEGG